MTSLFHGHPSRRYEAGLLSRSRIGKEVIDVVLERPAGFSFSPGQRIRLIHEKGERDYSLVSSPQDGRLRLLVRVVVGGAVSPLLAEAALGTSFSFTGPHGYFVWIPSERPPVFVATGTGVAPFISMARSGARGFVMLHGARSSEELYERSYLRSVSGKYVACLSASYPGTERDTYPGRVTAYLNSRLSSGVYDFYLCGRREMIRDVTVLADQRFPGSSVYAETFY